MDINCLNDDCFFNIFSRLSLRDLVKNKRVCRRWKCVIDDMFWQKRRFTYSKDINGVDKKFFLDIDVFDKCLKMMPNLVELTLDGVDGREEMVTICSQRCPSITRLGFLRPRISLSLASLKLLVHRFPRLTHLEMPNCFFDYNTDEAICVLTKNLKRLKHFNFAKENGTRHDQLTGYGLKYLGAKIETLMIGEPSLWDERLVKSLVSGSARNILVLSVVLLKLEDLKLICDNLKRLKEFYLTIKIAQDKCDQHIGCVKDIAKLKSLEVLRITDAGFLYHFESKTRHSIFTRSSLLAIATHCNQLRSLQILEKFNWYPKVENVDEVLSKLKTHCPYLNEFGISAGLVELRPVTCDLIASMHLSSLVLQGDIELFGKSANVSRRENFIDDTMVLKLWQGNPKLSLLSVSNSRMVTKKSLKVCLEMAQKQPKRLFKFSFANTKILPNDKQAHAQSNVSVEISQPSRSSLDPRVGDLDLNDLDLTLQHDNFV